MLSDQYYYMKGDNDSNRFCRLHELSTEQQSVVAEAHKEMMKDFSFFWDLLCPTILMLLVFPVSCMVIEAPILNYFFWHFQLNMDLADNFKDIHWFQLSVSWLITYLFVLFVVFGCFGYVFIKSRV